MIQFNPFPSEHAHEDHPIGSVSHTYCVPFDKRWPPYVRYQTQTGEFQNPYLLAMAACAAARRVIGTRNGEQDT